MKEIERQGHEMLKAFAADEVRPGMLLGRDAVDMDGKIVFAKDKRLDEAMIRTLHQRGVASVLIVFPEPLPDLAPQEEVLVDAAYADTFEQAYATLDTLLSDLCWQGTLDMRALRSLLESPLLSDAPDDARAISQIHNMAQEGDPILHETLGVAILARLMAHWLGFNAKERHDLITAALLYAAGKRKIPASILHKEKRLTLAEEGIVKEYPNLSASLLERTPLAARDGILAAIRQHRERLDGTGFPKGLRGAGITPLARILGILDLYIALAAKGDTDARRSPFEIFAILDDGIYQGAFDATYAVPFMRRVCHALYGNWVLLTDGTAGRIVYLDESRVTALPIVQRPEGDFIDLGRRKDIAIARILTAEEAGKAAMQG